MYTKATTLKLVCLFFLLLSFAACNEDTIEPTGEGKITGVVLKANTDAPIPGVSISTSPATTAIVTDAEGKFTLSNVPGGDYSITAKKAGLKTETVSVAVTDGNTTSVTLVLGDSDSGQSAPELPFNPDPADQTASFGITDTLRWSGADPDQGDSLFYDVYLYESGSVEKKKIATATPDTSVVVRDLKYNTTYFWQVVAKDEADNTTVGPVWSFSTIEYPDARYLFARSEGGNYDIYSATGQEGQEFKLTSSFSREWWPVLSPRRNEVAYSSNAGVEPQIYLMDRDGSNKRQITTVPVAGYHNQGIGFAWAPDGGQLIYPHYDNLYRIERDGSALTLLAKAPANRHFRTLDWTDRGNKIVAQTIGANINDSEIYLMDADGTDQFLLVENMPGRVESPVFSIDGKNILYTRDAAGFENTEGRQLDSRIYRKNIDGTGLEDLSHDKPAGTNDLYPRYSPTGAQIIFVNTPNDNQGPFDVYVMDADGNNRTLLFSNAIMPDWK